MISVFILVKNWFFKHDGVIKRHSLIINKLSLFLCRPIPWFFSLPRSTPTFSPSLSFPTEIRAPTPTFTPITLPTTPVPTPWSWPSPWPPPSLTPASAPSSLSPPVRWATPASAFWSRWAASASGLRVRVPALCPPPLSLPQPHLLAQVSELLLAKLLLLLKLPQSFLLSLFVLL